MSIKTLRKRIALVAVSALGASALALLSAGSASATAVGNVDFAAKSGTVNTGACSIHNGATAGATYAWFRTGSTVRLKFAAGGDTYLKISAGSAVWSAADYAEDDAESISATGLVVSGSAVANDYASLTLTGTGKVTVQVRNALTSAGTLVDVITIYSVAACGGGVFSAANSNVIVTTADGTQNDGEDYDVDQAAFNGLDRAYETTQDYDEAAYISAVLLDEYDSGLDSGAIVVTSTTGCNVGVQLLGAAIANPDTDKSVDTLVTEDGDSEFAVKVVPTVTAAGTPTKCTVTMTFDGTEVAKKVITFRGAPTQVLVDKVTVGQKDGHGAYRVTVKDSAGNPLGGIAISNSSTEANNLASALVVDDASSVVISTLDDETESTYGTTLYTTAALGAGTTASYSCTSKGGAAKITVRALVSALTYVTSAPFDVLCGGTAVDTWSMSLDKASYAPGEIATLTISAKDDKGLPVGTLVQVNDGDAIAQAFGGMEFVTAPAGTDFFTSGIGTKTYQLKVGTDEGAFVGTLKLSAAGTDDSAKTIQYKIVAPATGAVSNAEVLAAIVKLIASINKQIRALQKSLKKK